MPNSANSMSQNFGQHQQLGSFNFTPNGLQRSEMMAHHHHHHHHHHHQQQQQIQRDKLVRLQGFASPPLASIGEEEPLPLPSAAVYETNGMLSEMFNFPPGAAAAELLEHHPGNFRNSSALPPTNDHQWYGSRQGMVVDRGGDVHHQTHHHMSRINGDPEAAMQLFAMNPPPTSPSPPPAPAMDSSSTLHVFPQAAQFQWLHGGNTSEHGGGGGQGLSLSLSSSLKGRLEAAKADELKIGDVGNNNMFFFNSNSNHNQRAGASTVASSNSVGGAQSHRNNNNHHLLYSDNFGYPLQINQHHQLTTGLRNSKYAKATQELLEEFCSVGKGHDRFKNKNNPKFGNPSTWKCGDSSSSSKDPPPMSPSERIEHQRRRVKLLSMLDEVDRRYNHYCEQMQAVVNSFDVTMGYGAAVPYTTLAQKAMSRHFRCLKDAIAAQVRHSCELLGDKDGAGRSGASGSGGGITKGETPRLRLLEQSLRQQRAFHHVGMGMMEQEAWRPQRGLPERSVNILRAWLFEHFLHPYPSDADKLLLARQTGLSRNQVSNWFINARVRLWKPMVEDMYQQESKDTVDQNDDAAAEDTEMKPSQSQSQSQNSSTSGHLAQFPTTIPTTTTTTTTATGKGSETNAAPDSDTSLLPINRQRSFSENQATQEQLAAATQNFAGGDAFPALLAMPESQGFAATTAIHSELQRHHSHRVGGVDDACRRGSMVGTATYGTTSAGGPDVAGSAHLIRFGTTAGDVSLTLGLRHAGNQPEQTHFSVGGFGRC